jgi:CRP-like cAMP-binding protein
VSLLADIVAFAEMDPVERGQLERVSVSTEPRDDAEVFGQSDPADAVYAIVAGDGHVRIGAINQRGKSVMVELFRAGDIFGEIGVIDGRTRSAAAVAEGRVKLLRIPGSAFLHALSRSPALGEALCRSLGQHLRRTFELFQDASFETLEVRLTRQVGVSRNWWDHAAMANAGS